MSHTSALPHAWCIVRSIAGSYCMTSIARRAPFVLSVCKACLVGWSTCASLRSARMRLPYQSSSAGTSTPSRRRGAYRNRLQRGTSSPSVARTYSFCYEKGQEIKGACVKRTTHFSHADGIGGGGVVVMLEGTVIHKSGLIQNQLSELSKQKPRNQEDDNLISEMTRLESVHQVARDDLVRHHNSFFTLALIRAGPM